MAATQQRKKICCRTDLKGPLGLISVENGLRVPIACGRVREWRVGGKTMVVTRPEWATGNPLHPGPEVYAPPDRRAPGEPVNGARVAVLRPQAPDRIQSNEGPAAHLDALIRRIAGNSMDEIDTVIRELENIRALLRNEGERVTREIAGYASLSQASMTAMKAISDSLAAWKASPDRFV